MRMQKGEILALLIALATACPASAGKADDQLLPHGTVGVAQQMSLKIRLLKAMDNESLAVSLAHNRREWEMLSPDQRDDYRRKAVAFQRKDPEEQKRLLKHYEELIGISVRKRLAYRRTASWLKAVTATFTPEERLKLLAMPPAQRARMLIQRRDELIRSGKLPGYHGTALWPATAPTTLPARKQTPTTQPDD